MYLVVSQWQAIPGHEAEFEAIGRKVRGILSSQDGAELIEAFPSGDHVVVVHGYRDEATYKTIIENPDGVFAKTLAESRIEDHAKWLGSERGTTNPH